MLFMQLDYKHTSHVRVRYGETDQMGYCYYGNYAQFFEVGRVEAMRSLGCSYKKIEENGIMLPVAEFSVKYLQPAYYDDLLRIETQIVSLQGAALFFNYALYNESNVLLANATTKLIFVDRQSMRPIKPPQLFVELIQPFCHE
jgi:acyl-CoA thioester hydrolase